MSPCRPEPSQKGRRPRRLPLPPSLGYRNYRWYWTGLVASVLGFRSLEFAQFWQMHELTASPLHLGFLGLATGMPAIVLNLAGGVTADRLKRRRIVIYTQFGMAVPVFYLGIMTHLDLVGPIHVFVVSALVSGLNSFNTPARIALYPQYVEPEALLSAVAMNSAAWQTARVVAPAAAGIAVATVGTASVYFVSGMGMLLLGGIMCFLPDVSRGRVETGVFDDLRKGLRFIRRTPPFAFLIGITFVASFFGLSYVTLMPVFAVEVLGVGASGQGTMLAIAAVGSLLVTLLVGTRRSFEPRGGMMSVGAVLTALSLIAFVGASAVLGSYSFAIASIFFVGASSSLFITSVMTTLQVRVSDELRGRVMGFWSMSWNMMTFGGLFLGVAANAAGAPVAVATGGLIVLVGVALPVLLRSRNFRRTDHAP